MLMYLDPSMKEILDDFVLECDSQVKVIEDILFELEDDLTNNALFEKFGQVIDRMMGAAKSLEISEVAVLCELGKTLGYKSSQIQDEKLRSIVVAVMFDAIDLLRILNQKLKHSDELKISEISTEAFVNRMRWLGDKFANINRSSVVIGNTDNIMEQNDINDLLKQLGM